MVVFVSGTGDRGFPFESEPFLFLLCPLSWSLEVIAVSIDCDCRCQNDQEATRC